MSGYLVGTSLSEAQVTQLENTFDEGQVRIMLSEFLHLDVAFEGSEKKRNIATDFHFFNYAFCKAQAFDPLRTATFMSIMTEVFQADARSNSFDRNIATSVQYFQQLLLKHSVERPPNSVQVFAEADVEPLQDFVFRTYYKNYKVFTYIFGKQAHIKVVQRGPNGVEFPKVFPPLNTGTMVGQEQEEEQE